MGVRLQNDKCRERGRIYYREHKEEILRKRQLRRQRNPEQRRVSDAKYRESHKEQRRLSKAAYYSIHPEIARLAYQRHRARIMNAPGRGCGAKDAALILGNQKFRCWWCGCRLTLYDLDHRVPLSRGGSDDASNIVASCPSCNRSKQAKIPIEFCGRLL
jgi:5-methylcytosine-specific restriction endonuclease McrA